MHNLYFQGNNSIYKIMFLYLMNNYWQFIIIFCTFGYKFKICDLAKQHYYFTISFDTFLFQDYKNDFLDTLAKT